MGGHHYHYVDSKTIVFSIIYHEFESQFGLAIFIREKHPKPRGTRVVSACVYFNGTATGCECQRSGPSRLGANKLRSTCTAAPTVCVCMCVCSRTRVRVHAHACVRDVYAIYDDNI